MGQAYERVHRKWCVCRVRYSNNYFVFLRRQNQKVKYRAQRQSVRCERKGIPGDVAISSEGVYRVPEATIPESGYCSAESLNMLFKNQGTHRIWSKIWKKTSRIWR